MGSDLDFHCSGAEDCSNVDAGAAGICGAEEAENMELPQLTERFPEDSPLKEDDIGDAQGTF